MNRGTGRRNLILWNDGAMTVLWEDLTQGFEIGREYLLTIDCVGARISGYLDGVKLFSVIGNGPAAGSVGFCCWPTRALSFLSSKSRRPGGYPTIDSTPKNRWPPGHGSEFTRGALTKAVKSEPSRTQRFVASPFETGGVAFTADPIDLRISGPKGNEHERQLPT